MSEYVFRKKLLKKIKCQNGHIVMLHNNSVEIKVQYTSNPHKLSLKVNNLVGRAMIPFQHPVFPGTPQGAEYDGLIRGGLGCHSIEQFIPRV